jgi:hypothetical protein
MGDYAKSAEFIKPTKLASKKIIEIKTEIDPIIQNRF